MFAVGLSSNMQINLQLQNEINKHGDVLQTVTKDKYRQLVYKVGYLLQIGITGARYQTHICAAQVVCH